MATKRRFANDRIVDVLNYLDTPTADKKDKDKSDPWYFGWTEDQWRRSQDNLHQRIQSGSDVTDVLAGDYKMSKREIDKYIEWSQDPKTVHSRSVEWGTPHAQTGEILAQKILQASGLDASPFNNGNFQDTDLQVMIGNLRKLVDVQYRINNGGPMERMGIGTIMNIRNGTGIRAWHGAKDTDTLDSIIEHAASMNSRYSNDKLLHVRNEYGNRPGIIKDYIITGQIDRNKVNNLTGNANHGNWDPMTPNGLMVFNNQRLHDEMLGMTKQQLQRRNVDLIDARSKLKLNVPVSLIRELALEKDMIDPALVRAISQR